MSRLVVTIPQNGATGFGADAEQRCRSLCDAGYEFVVRLSSAAAGSESPDFVKHRIIKALPDEPNELIIGPPTILPTPGKRVCYYTTLESTGLAPFPLKMLSKANSILVPCRWNRDSLRALGLKQPIKIVPQGVDLEVFKPRPKPMRDAFLFGCAGNSAKGSAGRKGLETVIEAFQKAFPRDGKVVLMVKDHPGSPLVCFDKRVEIVRETWPQERLAQWYSSLDIFVSASHGEAWGRMLHEAMASGVPVMTARYGGVAEFFCCDSGFELDHEEVPAEYGWQGKWCQPELHCLASAMRVASSRPSYFDRLRTAARARALEFTWAKVNPIFIDALIDLGMIEKRPESLPYD